MPQRQVQVHLTIGPDRVMGRVYRSFQRMQCFRTRSYANSTTCRLRGRDCQQLNLPPGNGVTQKPGRRQTEIPQNGGGQKRQVSPRAASRFQATASRCAACPQP